MATLMLASRFPPGSARVVCSDNPWSENHQDQQVEQWSGVEPGHRDAEEIGSSGFGEQMAMATHRARLAQRLSHRRVPRITIVQIGHAARISQLLLREVHQIVRIFRHGRSTLLYNARVASQVIHREQDP